MKKFTSINDLFKTASAEPERVEEPVVEESAPEADMSKVAEELVATGGLLADAFVDRVLEKIAMAVAAGGGGTAPRSMVQQIAEQIAQRHGKGMKPGDDLLIRAEDGGQPGHGNQTALSGKKTDAKANYRG